MSSTTKNIWGVSDCHAYCKSGAWAAEAVKSNTYGVCVAKKSDSVSANIPITLRSGEVALVSKRCYNDAMKVAVGDTFYLADTKDKKVYRGTVVGQTIQGFVRSNSEP